MIVQASIQTSAHPPTGGHLFALWINLEVLLLFCASGCGTAPSGVHQDAAQSEEIELAGIWKTTTGEEASITSTTWGLDSIWAFDNEENRAITQTSTGHPSTVGLYNRIVWTEILNNSFYACYVLFGFDNPEDLLAAAYEVDSTDPPGGGCNGLPWFFFVREDSDEPSTTLPEGFADIAGSL